ncbi:MAG: hypothetical protein DWI00_05065 [Planctomycetota bacterium]|nr:MAG: hypothetical protein DWI00_05065 [Planctomycetota bacterium]
MDNRDTTAVLNLNPVVETLESEAGPRKQSKLISRYTRGGDALLKRQPFRARTGFAFKPNEKYRIECLLPSSGGP